MIRVQKEDFDIGREIDEMTAGRIDAGAIVSFTGAVRGSMKTKNGEERLVSMELEHYPGMTESELERLEKEARRRWRLLDCLIVHRYGRLEPGDNIVLVIAISAHRKDAFAAAQFIMDFLKTDAPFWKKETPRKGEKRWVEAKEADDEARKAWIERK
jgi:molybdopterin synthase catalytic subunit